MNAKGGRVCDVRCLSRPVKWCKRFEAGQSECESRRIDICVLDGLERTRCPSINSTMCSVDLLTAQMLWHAVYSNGKCKCFDDLSPLSRRKSEFEATNHAALHMLKSEIALSELNIGATLSTFMNSSFPCSLIYILKRR